MLMQRDNKKIAKNTVALYIRMAITMIVSFFSVRVTLQVLGSEDFGLNNLVGSIVAMFSFINGSMGTAVQRFYSYEIGKGNEQGLSKVFGVGMFLHICVALITLVIGEIFALFFIQQLNIPQERMFAANVVFQISLISLILNILNVPYAAILRAREDFDKFATLDILQAIGRLIILYFLCIIAFDKLITLSLLNFAITILYVGSVNILAKKYKETTFRIDRDKQLVKEMTGFISMLLFTVLFTLLRDKGLVLLLNLFFGLTINAAYAIAANIMHLANTFAMNFKQAIVPQLMAAYSADDKTRMNQLIFTGSKITFILMLLITVPIMLEPHFILDIILKDVPKYASGFTVLVLANVNIASFTYFLYQGVHATGKIKGQQIWMSALYLLNILFIYLIFKLGGNCYSAVYVTICCSIVQCLVNIIYAVKHLRLTLILFIKDVIAKSLILAFAVISVPLLLFNNMPESFIRFMATSLLMLILLCGGSFMFYFDKQERLYCRKALDSLKKKVVKIV